MFHKFVFVCTTKSFNHYFEYVAEESFIIIEERNPTSRLFTANQKSTSRLFTANRRDSTSRLFHYQKNTTSVPTSTTRIT